MGEGANETQTHSATRPHVHSLVCRAPAGMCDWNENVYPINCDAGSLSAKCAGLQTDGRWRYETM